MAQLSIEDVRQFLFREVPFAGRQGLGRLAILLRSGRGILDAVVGR